MKKNWRLLYAIMAIALILSACGTTDADQDDVGESGGSETPISEVEETNEEDANGDETNEDAVNEDETENATDEDSTNDKQLTEDEVSTETETETDFLNEAMQVESDAQDFSVYLLPEYKLTSEEPGKDSLYLEADDSRFMRIETMSPEDFTYEYLEENMLAVLEASSGGKTPVEITDEQSLPSDNNLTNAKAYTVDVEEGTVTGILFEREDLLVRLTIFDSAEAEHFEDFLHMGETITKN